MAVSLDRSKNSSGLPKGLAKFWQKQGGNIGLPLIGLFGFLAAWQILSWTKILALPGPIEVLANERSRYLIFHPFYYNSDLDQGLARQTFISLTRVAQGYFLAAIVGITLGIVVGTSPNVNKALDPIFQFLRMVAPLAWVPIALAALRQNEPAAIFVIFITSIWPILINTAVGVREIPQDYKNVARVLKISKQKFFLKILIPSALPYIFTGLRIAIGLAWLAIIAAEIVMSGVAGIGFFIWDAYQQNYVTEIIVAVVYIGAVGLALDRLVAFIQTKIAPGN
ncbi:nitrate ABC transporter permease [Synechococcus sp. PCC 6312]|uniref:nitrate ABC transporter permease n=1 Tax=Synechococcus sp. (strain ATCC 27167 / PCC 6312) TaxID=195253 RepID=UPI00029F0B33|nr:nitrate ABC transporter permease [Synechococcus sp. PCC 6312]AFY62178.1 nitrate ABC transporter, permease protein [Synechococcus sp. PCC 6312]